MQLAHRALNCMFQHRRVEMTFPLDLALQYSYVELLYWRAVQSMNSKSLVHFSH